MSKRLWNLRGVSTKTQQLGDSEIDQVSSIDYWRFLNGTPSEDKNLHGGTMYVHYIIEIVASMGTREIQGRNISLFNIIAALVSTLSHRQSSKQVSASHFLLYPPLTFLLHQERLSDGGGRRSSQSFVVRGPMRCGAAVLLLRPNKPLSSSCHHFSIAISEESLRVLEYLYNTVPSERSISSISGLSAELRAHIKLFEYCKVLVGRAPSKRRRMSG